MSRTPRPRSNRFRPSLGRLEVRDVPAGYLAIGSGPGGIATVAIRVDIQDALAGSPPNSLGQQPDPLSDGKTETTTQIFNPFGGFRGGVKVASGNFDGDEVTPDQLVTAAGAGGGPHIIVWNMRESRDGRIVTDGVRASFFAFDPRFVGGVNVTTGDLNGDGRAELITAAGPGGGPHVRVWTEVNGTFVLVNEFFAYDVNFRGGVNVGSGQGYQTLTQVRQPLDSPLPDDFATTPYNDLFDTPGIQDGVPLVGLDRGVEVGGIDVNNTGRPVPTGHTGTLDEDGQPFPYVTVASGQIQYLSANLTNSYNNIAYDSEGELVFASWDADDENFPGAPFQPDVTYGPFIRVGDGDAGDDEIIARIPANIGPVTFRNQLVTGPGAGGGAHVRVWEFAGGGGAAFVNEGVSLEFFAFEESFAGGVNVAIGSVVANPTPIGNEVTPGRTDLDTGEFIADTTRNSGSVALGEFPQDPNLRRKYSTQILVSQASGGSRVRVFSDSNPLELGGAPSIRFNVEDVVLVATEVQLDTVLDPDAPLNNFTRPEFSTTFTRAIDQGFTGGVSVAIAALTFTGSANDLLVGNDPVFTDPDNPADTFRVNPTLGQAVFGAGLSSGQASRGARVRVFNQLSPVGFNETEFPYDDAVSSESLPADDFIAFSNSNGGISVAFGFGQLGPKGVDIISLPAISIETLDNPLLADNFQFV